MKLELKHLAPYLTHKLKAKNCFNEIVEVKGIQFGNESCNNVLWTFEKNGDYLQGYLYQCKPILKPLSDLPKNEFISELGSFSERYKFNIDEVNYSFIEKLLKKHFDVYRLIDAGLAIDINTL